ncbi:MAG: spore protease YyaC [Syntrophomonadaceae bacterium]|nr:spore protease YyaC [Syntrophomonadaceae bacterium]
MKINQLIKETTKYSYHYNEPHCLSKIGKVTYDLMVDLNPNYNKEIVYLCIGTDRATGDCLGPLVGTRLSLLVPYANIFGTLQNPCHATNLTEILNNIDTQFNNPLIIAIDASLGNADRIGYINIKKGSLKPGTALKKVLPEVGDFHISGVVNVAGFLEHMVLQNTRLYLVYSMADIIAKSLYLAHFRFERNMKSSCTLGVLDF